MKKSHIAGCWSSKIIGFRVLLTFKRTIIILFDMFRFIPCDAWLGLVLPPLAGDSEFSWARGERRQIDNHFTWILVIEQLCR